MSGVVGDNTVRASGVIASAGGGGAYTFVASATADGSASLDVTTGIDSTYDVYLITVSNFHLDTDGMDINLLMSVGGSFITSTDYRYANTWASSSASYPGGTTRSDSQAYIRLQYNGSSDTTAEPESFYMWLYNPGSTTVWKNILYNETGMNQDGVMYTNRGAGLLENTGAVDGIRIKSNTTANVSTGVMRVYGLANS